MKKVILFSFFVLIIVFLESYSSFAKPIQIVVKGILKDELTGVPIEANIEFRTPDGRRFKSKSNSLDGKFEQVFNSGEEVDVILTNYDVVKKTIPFKVIDTIAYTEQKVEFTAKKLQFGSKLFKLNMFEPNSATLNPAFKTYLDSLKDFMMFNRNFKINISVNSHDTYSKEKIVTEAPKSAPKKKSKKPELVAPPVITIKEPDAGLIRTLVEQRNSVISPLIKDFGKLTERITVNSDFSVADVQDPSGLKFNPDVEFIVTEIKNPF